MKINWLAHATFAITSDAGTKIITDPIANGEHMTYDELDESADIVTVSHDHLDHCNVAAVKGNPEILRASAEVKGIKFKAIPSYHDASQGKDRGSNTMFSIELDGIRVFHPGDLGHLLSDLDVKEIGKVDIIFLPVGGHFTIDPMVAGQLCDQLKPKIIIPMHFKTDKCKMPIVGVDEFLKGKENVTRLDSSEVEFKSEELPDTARIIVMKPAL